MYNQVHGFLGFPIKPASYVLNITINRDRGRNGRYRLALKMRPCRFQPLATVLLALKSSVLELTSKTGRIRHNTRGINAGRRIFR